MKLEIVSLKGPVEQEGDTLVLRIPLDAGGAALVECSQGIADVEGEVLKISIPQWLADLLTVRVGDMVNVSNLQGRFNIFPADPRRPN
jgi:hypothetical protein